MSDASEVLTTYLTLCTEWRPRGLWSLVADAVDAYRPPRHETSVLEMLTERFLEADLVASGIVTPAEGGLLLRGGLAGDDGLVLVRRDDSGRPSNLLTQFGVAGVAAAQPTAMADPRYRAGLREGLPLIVVGSATAAALLGGLGLTTTLLSEVRLEVKADLDALTAACRRRLKPDSADVTNVLLDALRPVVAGPPSEAPTDVPDAETGTPPVAAEPSYSVVLADWSPADLTTDGAASLNATAAALAGYQCLPGYDLSWITWWRPPGRTLAVLRKALELRDAEAAAAVVLESLRLDRFELAASPARGDAADDYLAAVEILDAATVAGESHGSARYRQARRRAESVVRRRLVDPLRAEAWAESEPYRKSHKLVLAELAALVHVGLLSPETAADDELTGSASSTNRMLRLIDRYLATYREVFK